MQTPASSTLVLKPVSTADIVIMVCSLPQKSIEDIDGINTQLLQLSLPITAHYRRHIFNTSLAINCFPSSWKQAIISPIYKCKGSRREPGNYRPGETRFKTANHTYKQTLGPVQLPACFPEEPLNGNCFAGGN